MQELTDHAHQTVQNLAQRYNVSTDAVRTLLQAVSAGGGTMAQFYHPELGGGGQWMQGGMTMVGDMFNRGLQATVNSLCSELSTLLGSSQVYVPAPVRQQQVGSGSGISGGFMNTQQWWPAELGSPSSSGGQNDSRYAYFPQPRRLAIQRGDGQVTLYDTLDHQIGGVQQQQTGPHGSLSFSSQRGTFSVDSLPVVSGANTTAQWQPAVQSGNHSQQPSAADVGDPQGQTAVFAALDKLADLHARGVLSDDEFRTKKAELLARL